MVLYRIWTRLNSSSDICLNSIEGVPSICLLSNSHFVKNTKPGPYKLSEIYWKNKLISSDCCHTCVLVNCIGTYINRRLIGLPMCKRGIQPLLLALQTKLQITRYREIVTLSTESIVNLFEVLHMQPEIIC